MSSPYYDPVKAHEYYMKTRKLKGRKKKGSKSKSKSKKTNRGSTKMLNDLGKATAEIAKSDIMAERKQAYKQISSIMKQELAPLREQLKNIPNDVDLQQFKVDLQMKVDQIKQKYENIKAPIKQYYQKKYYQQLDKIRQNKSYLK